METEKTGKFLAALRRSRGLTQQQVAERLGISNKTVSKWEVGGGLPDSALLPSLAKLYHVTADEILAGERLAYPPSAEQERYRRDEFRFRAGTALALVLALWAQRYGAPFWLLPAGSLLAVWVSWSSLGTRRLAQRLRVLLCLGGILLYGVAERLPWGLLLNGVHNPDTWFLSLARQRLGWSAWLLLLAALYALLTRVLRRREGKPLLRKRCFWTALTGWSVSVAIDAARWTVDGSRWAQYLAFNRVHRELRREELLYGTQSWAGPVDWAALMALLALAAVWLWEYVRCRRKHT